MYARDMHDSVRDMLVRGVAAARVGDGDEARFYLEWVLRCGNAGQEGETEAWMWLSRISKDLRKSATAWNRRWPSTLSTRAAA
jgi:hypothetical protein